MYAYTALTTEVIYVYCGKSENADKQKRRQETSINPFI